MDILLCWSKERSKLVAMALHEWLPKVLPGIKPWMSKLDIDKGTNWFGELHAYLAEAKAVIVCVTPENVRSPWIYYESGRIAGGDPENLVCPFLLNEQPSILSDGPLGKMQCTEADKEDMLLLLKSLNSRLESSQIAVPELSIRFEREWNSLFGTLKRLMAMEVESKRTETFIATDADRIAGVKLTSEERTILIEFGQDKTGYLLQIDGDTMYQVLTNGKELVADQSPRTTAKWKSAIKSLEAHDIIDPTDYERTAYKMTAKGFGLFDILTAK